MSNIDIVGWVVGLGGWLWVWRALAAGSAEVGSPGARRWNLLAGGEDWGTWCWVPVMLSCFAWLSRELLLAEVGSLGARRVQYPRRWRGVVSVVEGFG